MNAPETTPNESPQTDAEKAAHAAVPQITQPPPPTDTRWRIDFTDGSHLIVQNIKSVQRIS